MAENEKINVKQFKSGESSFWVNHAHYSLNEQGEIIWHAGETDKEELRDYLQSFIKRNKKIYVKPPSNIFEQEEIGYSKVTFGKFSGMSTMEIVATDKGYSKWLYENTTDKNIKEELKQLLKIK
jgi:hypothetical protein